MSSTHVVVGAGAIGSATALQLARSGERVVVVTRRGSGPIAPEIALVAADASHAPAMADVAAGATAIYNCANPRYTRWAEDWPPIAAALLYAAERSGARLVTISNLYMYEPPLRPLVEGDPTTALTRKGQVRARMWEEALAAFDAGRAEVTEARASDFVGPGLTDQAHLGERVVPRVLAGKSVSVVGNPDMPHTWSYVPDVASTLVALGTQLARTGAGMARPEPPGAVHAPDDRGVRGLRLEARSADLAHSGVRHQGSRPGVARARGDPRGPLSVRATLRDGVRRRAGRLRHSADAVRRGSGEHGRVVDGARRLGHSERGCCYTHVISNSTIGL